MVQHLNEAVNKQGVPCDLHVEQVKADEFAFRHKSGNKGIVFVPSDDSVGVKLVEYDDIPLRTKYIVSTPNGFLLLIKTGDVDQKLEYLNTGGISGLRDAIDEYEERIVAAMKEAKADESKEALEALVGGQHDSDTEYEELNPEEQAAVTDVPAPGQAQMSVNTDDESNSDGTV
jgi:hypothetical protein